MTKAHAVDYSFGMKAIISCSIILLFISCAKKESSTPEKPARCRIASATYQGNLFTFTYTLTYNDSGKLTRLTYDGPTAYVKTYQYIGNRIYMHMDATSKTSDDTISLNDKGRIATIKITTKQNAYYTVFDYDINGQVTSSTTQQDNDPPVTTTYTFINGDLTNTFSNGVKDTTTYILDQQSVIGNLDDFNQLIYFGSFFYTNKHLKQSYSSWPNFYDYTYTFDSEGKIVKLDSYDGQSTESYSFTYECK